MNLKISRENYAIALAVCAPFLTGLLGVFKEYLTDLGMNNFDVTFIKFFVSTVVLGVILAFVDRKSLKIKRWQDLGFLTFFALTNIGLTVSIFYAMDTIGVGLSAALQATNTFFILIFAAMFFSEKITLRKVVAMCIAFVGCLCVVDIFEATDTLNFVGVLLAIVSAILLAVFCLGCKYAGKKGYTPGGTLFYLYLITVIVLLIIPETDVAKMVDITFNSDMAWIYIIGVGIIATMIPKYMITKAYQIADAGKIAVCVALDMVTSAVFGVIFLGENITPVNLIGMLLIIFSIALIQLKFFDKFFKDKSHGEDPT